MKLIIFSGLFLMLSCATDPHRVYRSVMAGEAILIDVREIDEVKGGTIQNAHWVPNSRMQSHPHETAEEVKLLAGERSIYVFCRSGRRSELFIDRLEERGIDAENFGGYTDLVRAGLPVKR